MHAVLSYQNYVMNKSLAALNVTQSSLLKKLAQKLNIQAKELAESSVFMTNVLLLNL